MKKLELIKNILLPFDSRKAATCMANHLLFEHRLLFEDKTKWIIKSYKHKYISISKTDGKCFILGEDNKLDFLCKFDEIKDKLGNSFFNTI